jgi:anthranilate synthase component 2
MHGKISPIFHNDSSVFRGLPSPFNATRYHSLVIDRHTVPDILEITAKTWDDEIMGVRHRRWAGTRTPIEGVQFHPESIMTPSGKALLKNFLAMVDAGAPRPEAGEASA